MVQTDLNPVGKMSWTRLRTKINYTFNPDKTNEKTRLGCFYVTAILSWGYGWVKVDVEAKFFGDDIFIAFIIVGSVILHFFYFWCLTSTSVSI